MGVRLWLCLLVAIALATMTHAAWAENLPSLVTPGHPGWAEQKFAGQTRYSFDPQRGLVLAESNATASGLIVEQSIDLRATPWLNWSWQVDNVLVGINEREKTGDDYPARVYVVVKGGVAFWKTRALTYVWASSEAVGSMWANAFTANAHMIALRSGTADLGTLVTEKRNIRADWMRAFGEDIHRIDAVAIMTDTDNSGQWARAWYGQPWFSAQ